MAVASVSSSRVSERLAAVTATSAASRLSSAARRSRQRRVGVAQPFHGEPYRSRRGRALDRLVDHGRLGLRHRLQSRGPRGRADRRARGPSGPACAAGQEREASSSRAAGARPLRLTVDASAPRRAVPGGSGGWRLGRQRGSDRRRSRPRRTGGCRPRRVPRARGLRIPTRGPAAEAGVRPGQSRGGRQGGRPHRVLRRRRRVPRCRPRPVQRGRGVRRRPGRRCVSQAPTAQLRGVRRAALLHRRHPLVVACSASAASGSG